MADPQLLSNVRALVGRQYGRVYAWDEINAPMIRQWCEVMGIDNPLYTDPQFALGTQHEGLIAPPAMLQVWTMEGLHANNYPPGSTDENPYEVLKEMEAYDYSSTVAVNSELSFTRPVRLGEKLYYTTRLDAVSDEKTTALGTGFFVTLVMSHFVEKPSGDEPVGELLFRVFKFRPANAQPPVKADAAPEMGWQSKLVPKDIYRLGIAATDQWAKSLNGKVFAEQDSATRDDLLKQLEAGKPQFDAVPAKIFFNLLLQNTKEGFFCDPIHGGNKGMVGWTMIGFPGARADFMDWVERNEQYPFPAVSIRGERA